MPGKRDWKVATFAIVCGVAYLLVIAFVLVMWW